MAAAGRPARQRSLSRKEAIKTSITKPRGQALFPPEKPFPDPGGRLAVLDATARGVPRSPVLLGVVDYGPDLQLPVDLRPPELLQLHLLGKTGRPLALRPEKDLPSQPTGDKGQACRSPRGRFPQKPGAEPQRHEAGGSRLVLRTTGQQAAGQQAAGGAGLEAPAPTPQGCLQLCRDRERFTTVTSAARGLRPEQGPGGKSQPPAPKPSGRSTEPVRCRAAGGLVFQGEGPAHPALAR